MPYELIIEEIPQYDVVSCPDNYNSCNHGARPDDYSKILEQGNTSNWVNSFHTDYSVINIFDIDLKWMKEAYKSGSYTGKFPEMFEEEKLDMLHRYKHLDKYFDGGKYFVRCNSVSLKYGQHGVGPYTNFEQIIESLVTCVDTHTPLDNKNKGAEPLTIYLLKWQNFDKSSAVSERLIKSTTEGDCLDKYKEYRIFVCCNVITAISQQNIYEVNEYLDAFPEEERIKIIEKHVQIIYDSFEKTIKKKITHTRSYCMDAVILEDDSLYFIEINSFGAGYAAGSALFHWINDMEILNRNEDFLGIPKIYFRYTV